MLDKLDKMVDHLAKYSDYYFNTVTVIFFNFGLAMFIVTNSVCLFNMWDIVQVFISLLSLTLLITESILLYKIVIKTKSYKYLKRMLK